MKEKIDKVSFFKRLWYSISKLEKYPDMAAEGFKRALGYLIKIVMILTLVIATGIFYQEYTLVQKGVEFLSDEFPEFSYKDETLSVVSEGELRINQEKIPIGVVIVDTNTEDENKVNEYINEIIQNGKGIIVLKDRVVIKNSSVEGTASYSYKDFFEKMNIKELNKQDVVNYSKGSGILKLYSSLFLTIFIYYFIMFFLTTISKVVLLSIFGYITTWLARIRMRYVAVFNMSAYAITLSVILNMLYTGLNIFVKFSMEYFQVMYIAVAAIYLVAAILILKSDFIKKQAELTKISETEENIKKETQDNKKEELEDKENKNNEENEENKKQSGKKNKNKKEKNNNKEDLKEEPEGSEA